MTSYCEGFLFKIMLCVENTEKTHNLIILNAYFSIKIVLKTCSSMKANLKDCTHFKMYLVELYSYSSKLCPINSHSDCYIMVVSFFSEEEEELIRNF